MPGFYFGVVRAHMDFDSATKCSEPGGEPVDSHALHAATKDFGKRWLVGAATMRGLLLRELAFVDGFYDSGDEHALRGEFRSLGGRKADIFKHVPAALVKCFDHFSILRVPLVNSLRLAHRSPACPVSWPHGSTRLRSALVSIRELHNIVADF